MLSCRIEREQLQKSAENFGKENIEIKKEIDTKK